MSNTQGRNTQKPLTLEIKAAQHINIAAEEAVLLSREICRDVKFVFNGLSVMVTSESTPDQIVDFYRAELNRSAEAYLTSPEGKAEVPTLN